MGSAVTQAVRVAAYHLADNNLAASPEFLESLSVKYVTHYDESVSSQQIFRPRREALRARIDDLKLWDPRLCLQLGAQVDHVLLRPTMTLSYTVKTVEDSNAN